MNPFTEHTQQQGITYFAHACFAMGIAWRLLASVAAFALHAIFPFIDIERRLDLEATAAFLQQRNRWIEQAKQNRPLAVSALLDAAENKHLRSGQVAGALSQAR
jgi:hypothetical protein